MVDLPLHESSATLLPGPLAELPTRIAAAGGLAGALATRLEPDPAGLSRAALVEAASAEADRLADIVVRPEHLVLGLVRATGGALARAREVWQLIVAERAYADYLELRPGGGTPVVVLVAGVPGTGKSTLAEGLARRLRAPVFSMDWQMGALRPFGVLRDDNVAPLAETNLTASVARQLHLGLDAVIDATGHRREVRDRWRALVERLGGVFLGVECVCSDEQAQRARVEGRSRGIPGWHATVSWEHVQRMKTLWEPWEAPHLVIDSAVDGPDEALAKVLARYREIAER
ncbi:AAA family ATPase [Saccharothrix obliqua]|uniref:AAA family ATPase n=1 Tax=Saccharothrix obliqua TaxID=2861747 RepID=UPI001C5F7664|nr:AAA family ATPase [Saccharothrix obliqua]MBW4717997.1 ATP-binding protein [Saccharothrix obliqua]